MKWTLIISGHIGATLEDYLPRITGFNKCRMTGKLDGNNVRIIPSHALHMAKGYRPQIVIFSHFEPTEAQRNELRTIGI